MITRILGFAPVYRLWIAPFAAKKMQPIASYNDLGKVKRVLDIGCGPGTNSAYFRDCQYYGLDLNPSYIQTARRLHPWASFSAEDATKFQPGEKFEFVLLNSLLHHLDDNQVSVVLKAARRAMTNDGAVHIIELVKAKQGIPAFLASKDRGEYPRIEEHWLRLFEQEFQTEIFEPFPVRGLGATLWEMVYFKGRLLAS
jgi:SAM-dependent methyltransferase